MKSFPMCVYVLVSLLFLKFNLAMAHEGHGHMPVTLKSAVEIALAAAEEYTQPTPPFGLPQLHESWRDLPPAAAKVVENGRGYYVVRVENAVEQRSLFVRILINGDISDANFSGRFAATPNTR